MRCTRIGLSLVLLSTLSLAAPRAVWGQDEPPVKHGRKYKAPPDTSHVEVIVTRHSNGKPIVNAAVVFNPSKDGKDEGNLEVKTDPEGKAIIDVIPTGSTVRIQIIAHGYATYAEDYVIAEPITPDRRQHGPSAGADLHLREQQGQSLQPSCRRPGARKTACQARNAANTPSTNQSAATIARS